MYTRQELEERYKRVSVDELCAIVYKPEDYTPEAVEAAQAELSARNVSQDYMTALFEQWREQEAITSQNQKKNEKGYTYLSDDILDAEMSDEPVVTPYVRKIIQYTTLIILAFSVYSLSRLVVDRRMYAALEIWMLPDLIVRVGGTALLIYGGYLLYRQRKAGWYIIVMYLGFTVATHSAELMFRTQTHYQYGQSNQYIYYLGVSGIICVVLLYHLLLRQVKDVYRITDKGRNIALGIPAFLLVILLMLSL